MQEDSPIYSVAASAYVSAEARRCLAKWWWAFLVPPVALAIAGAYDISFFYLCLMVSLIVYHMALSMMWMILACKPWMRLLTRPQHIVSDGRSATVFFHSFPAGEKSEDSIIASIDINTQALQEAENHGKYFHVYIETQTIKGLKYLLIPTDRLNLRTSASYSNEQS